MPQGGDHDVGGQHRAAGQPDAVAFRTLVPAYMLHRLDGGRRVPVHGDGGVRSEGGDGAAEEPFQVDTLQLPGGEGGAGEGGQLAPEFRRQLRNIRDGPVQDPGGPLCQAGAVDGGSLALDGGIREHRDVRRGGVEHQPGMLLVTPDPAGTRGVRLHDVDLQGAVEQLRPVGGEAFQQPGRARAAADEDHGRGIHWHDGLLARVRSPHARHPKWGRSRRRSRPFTPRNAA